MRDSKGRERVIANIVKSEPILGAISRDSSSTPVPADADDELLEKEAAFEVIERRLEEVALQEPPVLGQLVETPAGQPSAEAQMWACNQLPDADVAHIRERLVRTPWRGRPGLGTTKGKNLGGSHFFGRPP